MLFTLTWSWRKSSCVCFISISRAVSSWIRPDELAEILREGEQRALLRTDPRRRSGAEPVHLRGALRDMREAAFRLLDLALRSIDADAAPGSRRSVNWITFSSDDWILRRMS